MSYRKQMQNPSEKTVLCTARMSKNNLWVKISVYEVTKGADGSAQLSSFLIHRDKIQQLLAGSLDHVTVRELPAQQAPAK